MDNTEGSSGESMNARRDYTLTIFIHDSNYEKDNDIVHSMQ